MAKINVRDRNKNALNKKPNWEYRFEAAKIKGKRRCISKSGFRTKKEALEAGAKALAEYNSSGLHFEPSGISFADYIEYWYQQYCVTNLKFRTLKTKAWLIQKILLPTFGQYRLSSITPERLQVFFNDLVKQGRSADFSKKLYSILNSALNYAVYPLCYIKENPINYVRFPRTNTSKHTEDIVSMADFEKIIDRFPEGNRYHIPLLLGWFCGLRVSEALALTWDDVDFENKTINICKQLTRRQTEPEFNTKEMSTDAGEYAWYLGTPKCNSNRVIKIGDTLIEKLRAELQRQKVNAAKYGNYYTTYCIQIEADEKGNPIRRICPNAEGQGQPFKPICVDENGDLTTTKKIRYCMQIIKKQLGINLHFHQLRHTHATMLIAEGVSPKAVQQRLGHKDIRMTLQVYVKTTDEMQQTAVDAFEKASKALSLNGAIRKKASSE